MHLVLLALLAFANYQGSMSANCKDGWTYYQQDKTCLREHDKFYFWMNSRVACKQEGGDIVEFHTKDKERIAASLRKKLFVQVWTGLSDLDQDGTFEYINGTVLVEDARPLGKYWKSLGSSPPRKECVVINSEDKGLYHEDCKTGRYPICEIKLQPGPTTVVGSPACKRSTWAKIGQKFLYFHRELANFSTASKYCSAYGGQLWRPSSAEEAKNVAKKDSLWKPGAWFFWIGLKQTNGSVWTWDGGESLADGQYSDWSTLNTETSAELCAAIVLADSNIWHKIACKSLNFFTCEASSPCGTTIFMALNGVKQFENNTAIESQYKKSVLIECFQEGTEHDVQISIECTSVPEKMEGSRRVNMSLPKKYRKSGTSCTCTFVYKNGTSEVFSIKFKADNGVDDGADHGNNDAEVGFSWPFLFLSILFVLLLVGGLIMGDKKQKEGEDGDNNEAIEDERHEDVIANGKMEFKEGDTLEAYEAEPVEDKGEEENKDLEQPQPMEPFLYDA